MKMIRKQAITVRFNMISEQPVIPRNKSEVMLFGIKNSFSVDSPVIDVEVATGFDRSFVSDAGHVVLIEDVYIN